MLFPYSIDLRLHRWAIASYFIGVACCLIFSLQLVSDQQYESNTLTYCRYDLTDEATAIFNRIGSNTLDSCARFFFALDFSSDAPSDLSYFAFTEQLSEQEETALVKELERFNSIVSPGLTSSWWHDPRTPDVLRYFTSSILHVDATHLIFNLIFFFAFAIALEQTIGTILFVLFCGTCCISTGLAYQQGILGADQGLIPTIGLSGVVAGIMAFCLVVYPLKKVNVFYWLLIILGTIKVPLAVVVTFYILSDLYGLAFLLEDSNVDYVSHVAGSLTGLCGGILYKLVQATRASLRPSSCPPGPPST